MNTPTDVAQEAIDSCGCDVVLGDISEGTREAQVVLRKYRQVLMQLHRAVHWDFARKQADMVLLADATGQTANVGDKVIRPWIYEYEWPIDCMKVRFVPFNFNQHPAVPPGNIQPTILAPQPPAPPAPPTPPPTPPTPPPQAKTDFNPDFGPDFGPAGASGGKDFNKDFSTDFGGGSGGGGGIGTGDFNKDFSSDFGGTPTPPPPPPPYVPPAPLTGPLTTGMSTIGTGMPMRPARFLVATDFNYPPEAGRVLWEAQGVSPQGRTVVLTNVPRAQLVYTALMLYPSVWDALFRAAFVAFLAAEVALPLNRDKKLGMQMRTMNFQIAKQKIEQARIANGNEGVNNVDYTTDWMRFRNSGWRGLGERGGDGGFGVLGYGWDRCGFEGGEGTPSSAAF